MGLVSEPVQSGGANQRSCGTLVGGGGGGSGGGGGGGVGEGGGAAQSNVARMAEELGLY